MGANERHSAILRAALLRGQVSDSEMTEAGLRLDMGADQHSEHKPTLALAEGRSAAL